MRSVNPSECMERQIQVSRDVHRSCTDCCTGRSCKFAQLCASVHSLQLFGSRRRPLQVVGKQLARVILCAIFGQYMTYGETMQDVHECRESALIA